MQAITRVARFLPALLLTVGAIGCATAPGDAEVSARAAQVLKSSFSERGQAKLDRLDQDDTQRLCTEYAGKPLPQTVAQKIEDANKATIRYPADGKFVGDWKNGERIAQEGRGIQLVKLAGGYRLVTKPDFAPWLKRLDKAKAAQKLSRSALESLAIIAYKQPLVRAEIEEIRGVETSGVLRTLLERKLVRIVGRKEVPGRPIMYGTTKFFLEHFGLQDITQLPPLREFKELGEAEQALLPMEQELAIVPDASPVPEQELKSWEPQVLIPEPVEQT